MSTDLRVFATEYDVRDRFNYLQALAMHRVPPDVQEFGERHKIPAFASATWAAGFIDCYRLMMDGKLDDEVSRLSGYAPMFDAAPEGV